MTKHLESRSGITASGQFVGTIDYMSPEQIEGREVDSRTDIYSLGCVIFESLVGATPFRRETDVAVLWAHMREDPPPLSEVRPDLPRELDGVLAKAMAKAPDERYPTCRELVADLRRALGAAGAETHPAKTATAETEHRPQRATSTRTALRPRRIPKVRFRALLTSLAALLAGAAGGIVAYELVREVEPRIVTVGATRVPLDRSLLALIPRAVQERCDPKERLTLDFQSSIICRPGGSVRRVEYNKAESNRYMRDYFERRVWGEGVLIPGEQFRPVKNCGRPTSLQEWRRTSGGGHEPVEPGEDERGRVMCYRRNGWAAIEWTDQDTDVYTVAYGRDLIRLYRWWRGKAGPVPAAD